MCPNYRLSEPDVALEGVLGKRCQKRCVLHRTLRYRDDLISVCRKIAFDLYHGSTRWYPTAYQRA